MSALASGACHVATTTGARPTDAGSWGWRENEQYQWEAKGPRVGWLDDSALYLEPDAAYKAAHSMAVQGSGIEVGPTTIWKRLRETRALVVVGEARETLKVLRTIEGARRSVIALQRDACNTPLIETPDQPDQPDLWVGSGPKRRWDRVLGSGKPDQPDHNPISN